MRLAHATDIHWFSPPRLRDLELKRVWGTLNLYVRGRRHEFDPNVQDTLVSHLLSLKPDLVLITGDLTAQALPSEFEIAKRALTPLLDSVPTLVLPGNHDVYTPKSSRARLFWKTFGPWAGDRDDTGLTRRDLHDTTVFGLDPTRPTTFGASGLIPERQLTALGDALSRQEMVGRNLVVGIHYPPIDRRGVIYDGARHGLLNARALVDLLSHVPHKPCLIACGHVHHGFRAELSLPGGDLVSVINCGTSGQTYEPHRGRAASMGLYTLEENKISSVQRFVHDGARFVSEAEDPSAKGSS